MSEVFESHVINFEFLGEVGAVEHTPRFGNLIIRGCGTQSLDIVNLSDHLHKQDLTNLIDALIYLRNKAFPGEKYNGQ